MCTVQDILKVKIKSLLNGSNVIPVQKKNYQKSRKIIEKNQSWTGIPRSKLREYPTEIIGISGKFFISLWKAYLYI